MKISEAASQKIKNMSLLCAILVVSIHIEWTHDQTLSVGWFIYNAIKGGIARIAVPFFFVVSGFFLARHFDEDQWWTREVGKRTKSLVVPFLLWSIISFGSMWPVSVLADLVANRPFGTSIYIPQDCNWLCVFGLDLTEFPRHVPLWYVRCLFLFALTGSLFKACVTRFKYAWLAGAFAFLLVYNHLPTENLREFFRMGYSAGGIFYFSVGVAIQRFCLTEVSRRIAVICGIVGLALLGLKLLFAFNAWRGEIIIGKLSIPFLVCFVWRFMTARKLPEWLTSCSFPIFLMHAVLFAHIWFVLKYFPLVGLAKDFAMFVGSILGSIAIATVLRRFTPRLASMLFGGR